jgi:hypothetical protein
VLNEMGRAGQVLDEVRTLSAQLARLPAIASQRETIQPWNVRETLLDAGRRAAVLLRRWEDALDLDAQLVASKRGRAAPATDVAKAQFNAYGPLLHLDRAEEALVLLLECRQVFQDIGDVKLLGKAIGALADVESQRGRGEAAVGLVRDALRYEYLAGDVNAITVCYQNLGTYLGHHTRKPVPALACHLAAALIGAVTSIVNENDLVDSVADDFRDFGAAAIPPAGVPDLCRLVGDIPGTDLAGLIAAFCPDADTADQALCGIIGQARAQAGTPPDGDARP